ncbi:STAS domain-containing protein [Amycolatopsis sp. NPDC059027]|uniref:STAS domain-containing protein n=1 Tax=unclassified Amycolatopsis TaxID=2618356 RepID=UPI00367172E3
MPVPMSRPSAGADPRGTGELFLTITRRGDDTAVLTVVGDIDVATADQFRAALLRCDARCSGLVVDLSRVDFLGCAGVRALLNAGERNPEMVVVASGHAVRRALKVTGAERGLDVRGVLPELVRS